MKTSFEKSLSDALGRARLKYVLKPQDLVTSVSPQSHFAERPTMAFRLSSAEFNEVGWGMQSCATGVLQFDDVLFALLVAGTHPMRRRLFSKASGFVPAPSCPQ